MLRLDWLAVMHEMHDESALSAHWVELVHLLHLLHPVHPVHLMHLVHLMAREEKDVWAESISHAHVREEVLRIPEDVCMDDISCVVDMALLGFYQRIGSGSSEFADGCRRQGDAAG